MPGNSKQGGNMIKNHFYYYRWIFVLLMGVLLLLLILGFIVHPSQQRLQRLKKTLVSQRNLAAKNQNADIASGKLEKSMLTALQQLAMKNGVMLDVALDNNSRSGKQWRLRGRGSIVGWFALQNTMQSTWRAMIDLQHLSIVADQLLIVDAVMMFAPIKSKTKNDSSFSQMAQQSFCVAAPSGAAFPAAMLAQLTSFNALRLVGIISLANQSRAFFQLSTGKILSVRVGDTLGLENYRVMAITRQQVTMQKLNGQRLQLGLMR
jgi:hypothetical protein